MCGMGEGSVGLKVLWEGVGTGLARVKLLEYQVSNLVGSCCYGVVRVKLSDYQVSLFDGKVLFWGMCVFKLSECQIR